MADTIQSLDQLGTLKPAAPEAPKYVQKLDKQGRAYATGKRKNAVARVWIKPGAGKIVVNERAIEVFFARPVLRMLIQQPIVAMRLRGKHKPTFTPHVDDGDNVIIVNAEQVVLTGRKRENKVYHHHTGYIGGVKERTAKYILESRFPERVVEKAVQRMLPHGPLGRQQFGNLRVYKGPDHPHAAQQPEKLDIAAMNRKNARA